MAKQETKNYNFLSQPLAEQGVASHVSGQGGCVAGAAWLIRRLIVCIGLAHLCLYRIMYTDKICMMMTRLACNRAIESSYWRMDNNSDVGLLMGYVLYRLLIELESMDLDTFSH
jgi:hypothetical protein